jgi:hypothetical protein
MTREVFANLSDVEPLEVEWLIEPYIPFDMITLIEGDPGIGKSYLAMHWAAQVSVGGRLPGMKRIEQGKVLYMSAEDDPSFTIRPRIEAMGGDPRQIRYQARYLALDDEGLRKLKREVRAEQTDFVVLDPLYAYVPGTTDMYRPNTIRALLSELNDIAKHNSTAILLIRHLTKAKHEKAIYQGAGSIDVIGAARSGLLVAEHPDESEVRVIAHIKHNLSKQGPSLQYRLSHTPGHDMPIVEWLGQTTLQAEDLLKLSSAEAPGALEQAVDFLKDQLEEGPKGASRIFSAGEKRSISKRTLDRAKQQLNVRSTKTPEGWQWELPKSKHK